MSLSKEKLQVESKINHLKKSIADKQIEADMYIHTIREEASPYLELSEIDIEKIKVAVASLDNALIVINYTMGEIKRLERMI